MTNSAASSAATKPIKQFLSFFFPPPNIEKEKKDIFSCFPVGQSKASQIELWLYMDPIFTTSLKSPESIITKWA